MDHALCVGISNRLRNLLCNCRRLTRQHGSLFDPSVQAGPFNETHREEMLVFMLAHFVDRHDAGVFQTGRRFRFDVETLHSFW